jgi:hypothetical protein
VTTGQLDSLFRRIGALRHRVEALESRIGVNCQGPVFRCSRCKCKKKPYGKATCDKCLKYYRERYERSKEEHERTTKP